MGRYEGKMETMKYAIVILGIIMLGLIIALISALLPYMLISAVIVGLIWVMNDKEREA